jgi:hypothetical protein
MAARTSKGVNSVIRAEVLRQWTDKETTATIRASVGMSMFTATLESAIRNSAIDHAPFAHVEFDIVTEEDESTFKTLVENAGFNIIHSEVTVLEDYSKRFVIDIEFLTRYNPSNPYSATILGISPSEARKIVYEQLKEDAIELISTKIIPKAIKAAIMRDYDLQYVINDHPMFAEEVANILRKRGFDVSIRYFYDDECEKVFMLNYNDTPKAALLYITWGYDNRDKQMFRGAQTDGAL